MSLVRQAHGKDVTFSMPKIWRMLAENQIQVPIKAVTGEVRSPRKGQVSSNPPYQDLESTEQIGGDDIARAGRALQGS